MGLGAAAHSLADTVVITIIIISAFFNEFLRQHMSVKQMRQVPLECDINIAVSGPFWVEVANPEHPFTAMLISHSRGTCLIAWRLHSHH